MVPTEKYVSLFDWSTGIFGSGKRRKDILLMEHEFVNE